MRALLQAGRVVKFWADNAAYSPGYTEALQDQGIEVLYGPATLGFEAWIRENGADLDGVLLSRPDVATKYLPQVRRHSTARLAYYGHDLHGARMRRQGALLGNSDILAEAETMEVMERQIWRRVDVVLYPSAQEAAAVAALEPAVQVRDVVPYGFAEFGEARVAPASQTILFVAGFGHPPNEDAVCWFVAEILPLIRRTRPDAALHIVGSNPTQAVQRLAGEGIIVMPNVTDAELARCYRQARVAVVPLRFGAGVKLKVVEALARGLPLVTTPTGAQGCEGLEDVIPVVSDPVAFAAAVAALLGDDVLWASASARQIDYARERFSEDRLRDVLLEASGL
jgi:glycosyltransferase involved in cell wall biosynthesis